MQVYSNVQKLYSSTGSVILNHLPLAFIWQSFKHVKKIRMVYASPLLVFFRLTSASVLLCNHFIWDHFSQFNHSCNIFFFSDFSFHLINVTTDIE